IVWFDRYTDHDHERMGGKNASLGEMMAAGLPVPPGFAITTEAYHTLRDHPEVRAQVRELVATVDLTDADGLERISARVRAIVDAAELPDEVQRQVAEA